MTQTVARIEDGQDNGQAPVVDACSIWETYGHRLHRYIQRRVSNHADAEDILHDTFLKSHRGLARLRHPVRVEGWLFQIARNAITDYYRKRASDTAALTEEGRMAESLAEPRTEWEDPNAEIAGSVMSYVDRLPQNYRRAIEITAFEGATQKELAERLGISVSGAKSRVQRARAKLKKMLLDCCHFEFDRVGNIIDYQQRVPDVCCDETSGDRRSPRAASSQEAVG